MSLVDMARLAEMEAALTLPGAEIPWSWIGDLCETVRALGEMLLDLGEGEEPPRFATPEARAVWERALERIRGGEGRNDGSEQSD